MSVYAGPADWWTEGTDAGRTHIATKGIIQDGLVLNLDAGVSSSYPGSGTTWTDLSGNNNNGSLQGGLTYESQYFLLDGTDDKIEITNNGQLTFGTNPYTLSVWVYRIGSTTVNDSIIAVSQALATGNWQLDFSDTVGSLRYYYDGGSNISTTYDAPDQEWFNVVVSREGTGTNQLKIYINGDLIAQVTSATNHNYTTGLRIGANRGNSVFFNCRISNVLVYSNKGLSQEEIRQNFNATRNRYGI
jgi:hypothetical protein